MGLSNFLANEAGNTGGGAMLSYAPKVKAAKKGGDEPQSLASQIGGAVKGVVPGIFHLGKGIAEMSMNAQASTKNTRKMMESLDEARQNGEGFWGQVGHGIRDRAPILADSGASMKRTGGRLVDLGSVPFGKQTLANSQYGRASKNGTIVGTILEDAGNVAIVGGVASKALGGAAAATGSSTLGKVAAGAERVTGAANAVADLPARPLQLAARGVGAAGRPILSAALNTERGMALQAALEASNRIGPNRQLVKDFDAQIAEARLKAGDLERKNFLKAESSIYKTMDLAKEAGVEYGDVTHGRNLQRAGLAPLFDIIDQAPPELRDRLIRETMGTMQAPSAGALEAMRNPDLMAQATEARAGLDDVTRMREGMQLERGTLQPEQLADEPIQYWTDRELQKIKDRRERVSKKLVKAEGLRAKVATEQAQLPGYDTVKPVPTAKEATVLGSNLEAGMEQPAVVKAVTKLDKTMLADAKKAGKLGEIKGVKSKERRLAAGKVGSAKTSITRLNKLLADTEAKLNEGTLVNAPGKYRPALLNYTKLQKALKMWGEDDLAAQVPTTMKALKERGIVPEYQVGGLEDPTFRDALGPGKQFAEKKLIGQKQKKAGDVLKSDRREAERLQSDVSRMVQNDVISQIKADRVKTPRQLIQQEIDALDQIENPTPDQIAQRRALEDLSLRGHDIGSYMRDKGYASIAGRTEDRIGLDSEYIDAPLLKRWKELNRDAGQKGVISKAYDKTTSAWKHGQLPLSPAWNVGNALSQLMMMSMRGGMNPADALSGILAAGKDLRAERRTGEALTNSRFHGLGGTQDAIRQLELGGKRSRLSRVIQKGYDLNEFMDTAGKEALFREQLRKGVDPATATEFTLRTMGDMSNLKPVERQIKKIAPFYPWQKHATRMGIDMVTRHPWRTAAIMNLTQQGRGDPSDPANQIDPMDKRSSMLGLGTNIFLPLGGINPFESSTRSPVYSPSEALRSLNPVIKAGAFALGDINLNKMRTNTRPGGTTGKFSMPSLKEDLYYLANQTGPIGRGIIGGIQDPVLRYDQGSVRKVRGREAQLDGGRLQAAYAPLNLPFLPQFLDEKALEKRKKDALAKKRREKAKK